MAEAIRVDGVTRLFDDHLVLEDVTFSVQDDEILVIIGENGSGKSTLLKTMIGVLQPRLGSVSMRLSGTLFRDVHDNRRRVKRYCGFGSQDPSFYDELTVWENLVYTASQQGTSALAKDSYIEELCDQLHLSGKLHSRADSLSGGMRKRLDIACAAVHKPRYIFLDEPASDLDPGLRDTVWSVLNWLRNQGSTVVISSHYVQDLRRFADRVLVLNDGRVAHLGDPGELRQESRHFTVEVEFTMEPDAIAEALRETINDVSVHGRVLVAETENPQFVYHCIAHHDSLNDITDIVIRDGGLRELIE